MHTGPQFTSPTPPQGPGGGRGGALLAGGIAFAIVFLMIVGLTVGYLVVRTSTSGSAGGAATTSQTATTDAPPTETSEAATSEVTEARCWSPEPERTSSNPSGRLRGGGLQFIPPAGFDNRSTDSQVDFLDDAQTAHAPVESSWVSTLTVGRVEWQPGVEYPGEEEAAERLVDCLVSNAYIWGDTSERTLHDEITEPVTIAGMSGYRHSAVVKFGQHDLTKTDSTEIVAVVVDTPEGPSAFISEVAIGVTEHEEGAEAAYDSLTGV